MRQLSQHNPDIKECPCGNQFIAEQGNVDYGYKDELGKVISDEAAVHMSKNRINCPKCHLIFCSNCKAAPYHLGKTCEENQAYKEADKCRFCEKAIKVVGGGALANVCGDDECQAFKAISCTKNLDCGHACLGCKEESKCLPCLNEACLEPESAQNEDDYCGICFTSAVKNEPCVQLSSCHHVFHFNCLSKVIQDKWPSPRIVFKFLNCPTCNVKIETSSHQKLQSFLSDYNKLEESIREKALVRAKIEGLDKDEKMKNPKYNYYNDLEGYAMYKCSYYMCFKCKVPYFGGLKDCDAG